TPEVVTRNAPERRLVRGRTGLRVNDGDRPAHTIGAQRGKRGGGLVHVGDRLGNRYAAAYGLAEIFISSDQHDRCRCHIELRLVLRLGLEINFEPERAAFFGALSTPIVPPCNSTSCLAMAR